MKNGALCFLACLAVSSVSHAAGTWKASYPPKGKACHFTSTGKNAYFILEPGYKLELDSPKVHDVLTVLDETKVIDGVETRVIEDREMNKKGELEEVTLDYYAICVETNTVYYFGEDVDAYKNGKVTGHGGSWLSGIKGAHYGVMMPGKPKKGMKYYEEKAPGVDMDHGEVIGLEENLTTKAGDFGHCMRILGTNELEPDARDYKLYAPGVGVVKDGDLVLVKYGYKEKK